MKDRMPDTYSNNRDSDVEISIELLFVPLATLSFARVYIFPSTATSKGGKEA